jgi:redox-sensing transcriptional repressor
MHIKANIKRLLLYRLCLLKFREMGFQRVFSYNLGVEARVTPEQIRKDFSHFGITGNKKGGYEIDNLIESLDNIFKNNQHQWVILVGMGNIGQALSHYICGFTQRKQYIIAGFDIDPSKIKKGFNIPVYAMPKLREFINKNKIKIAILAVPAISAQEVCNQLIECGVKGIMNFAPIVLQAPHDVIINNINLCDELESVIYTAVSDHEFSSKDH